MSEWVFDESRDDDLYSGEKVEGNEVTKNKTEIKEKCQ